MKKIEGDTPGSSNKGQGDGLEVALRSPPIIKGEGVIFSSDPEIKNLPSNARGTSSIPSGGTKVSHACRQLQRETGMLQ